MTRSYHKCEVEGVLRIRYYMYPELLYYLRHICTFVHGPRLLGEVVTGI